MINHNVFCVFMWELWGYGVSTSVCMHGLRRSGSPHSRVRRLFLKQGRPTCGQGKTGKIVLKSLFRENTGNSIIWKNAGKTHGILSNGVVQKM